MRRLLPLIAMAAALGSCAHVSQGPLTLGTADSGKTIALAVRQTVTVRLPADPTTGYRWQPADEPDARVLIIEDSGYDRPLRAAPGTPGQAWWKLRGTGPGSTSVAWRYVRPWVTDEQAQTFTLTVNVGLPDLVHWPWVVRR